LFTIKKFYSGETIIKIHENPTRSSTNFVMSTNDDDFNYDETFKARARTGVAAFLSTIKSNSDLCNDSQVASSSSNVNTNSIEYLRGEQFVSEFFD
jgi:hypothetical protein